MSDEDRSPLTDDEQQEVDRHMERAPSADRAQIEGAMRRRRQRADQVAEGERAAAELREKNAATLARSDLTPDERREAEICGRQGAVRRDRGQHRAPDLPWLDRMGVESGPKWRAYIAARTLMWLPGKTRRPVPGTNGRRRYGWSADPADYPVVPAVDLRRLAFGDRDDAAYRRTRAAILAPWEALPDVKIEPATDPRTGVRGYRLLPSALGGTTALLRRPSAPIRAQPWVNVFGADRWRPMSETESPPLRAHARDGDGRVLVAFSLSATFAHERRDSAGNGKAALSGAYLAARLVGCFGVRHTVPHERRRCYPVRCPGRRCACLTRLKRDTVSQQQNCSTQLTADSALKSR